MKHLIYILAILTVLTVYSCATPRHTTQLVRDIQRDTIYMTSQQYDSIYIYHELGKDYRKGIPNPSSLTPHPSIDTVYLKDVSIEYRYKLLRDTVRIVHRDSIPYEVTVVETKEITRPLTTFDHICRFCFIFILSGLFVGFVKFVVNLKKNLR